MALTLFDASGSTGKVDFTGGTDLIFLMYGHTAALKLSDFIWG